MALIGVGGTLAAGFTTGILSNRAQRRGEEAREREQIRQVEAAKAERTHALHADHQVWLREQRQVAYTAFLERSTDARTLRADDGGRRSRVRV